MNDKTDHLSCRTEVKEQCTGIKKLLDGRTERISIPKLKPKNLDVLTVKPPKKYKERQEIAKGGMKRIIQVKDRDTARDLAMAVLVENTESENGVESRFIHEARITANLEHPNIVPIHDIGVDEKGKPYFTMKLIEGETLAAILSKVSKGEPEYVKQFTIRNLLRIFLKICDAVDFAHSKGIIHLDLKPENIQIGNYGEVLVLDWGLAKIINDGSSPESMSPVTDSNLSQLSKNANYEKTLDGDIKGTPGFMAPEQAAGDNSLRTEATDIYALGTILYAILTFRKPIKVDSIQQALDDTVGGRIIPIHERNPSREIPKPIAAVAMKAMSLKQEDRYASVQELIRDVDAFLGGYVTAAEDAGLLRHCELLIKRNKITSMFIALFLMVVIIAFLMLFTYKMKRSSSWGEGIDITPNSTSEFAEKWTPYSGNWEYRNGNIYAAPGKGESFILLYNKKIDGNIAVEFDAEIPDNNDLNQSGDLSVLLAASKDDPKNVGYYVQLGGLSNTSAVIQRRNGFMASVGFSVQAGKKYHIRVEKEAARIRLYCNGEKILTARDIFYLEEGYMGLYTFGKGKIFSNIRIFRKDVPELVPATVEGDAFYRESRVVKTISEQRKFLSLAQKAYEKVYLSHPNTKLGAEALLKKAYISSELGGRENMVSAIHDILLLKDLNPSFELLLLEGKIYFDNNEFAKAYATYSRAVEKYPESGITVSSLLTGQLSPEKSKLICRELRQSLWGLCAANDPSPMFRCSNRNLESIDFLDGLNFKLLDCSKNRINSLKPLFGMQLEELNCADNHISSLSPLKGMPLRILECAGNQKLDDISPVVGMPLKTLTLHGCTSLKDLTPLKECKSLEKLTIPKGLRNIEFLKDLPNLKYLNTEYDNWQMTKEEFFRTH